MGIPLMETPSGVNLIMLLSEGAAGLTVDTSNLGKLGLMLLVDGEGLVTDFSTVAFEEGADWPHN
jgi:hypothetical protein